MDFMHISIGKMKLLNSRTVSLPPAVIEIFKKAQGLSLISGPRGSGRTTLSRLLAQEVGKEGYQSIAVFCDDPEEYKGHDAQVFPLELLSAGPSLLRGV